MSNIAQNPIDLSEAEDGVITLDSVRSRAIRASVWTISGYIATRSLRLVSSLILTRLLLPEHFGLMVVVNLVLNGLQMFSDIGIAPSIIQNKRGDDPAFLNTAWTIQIIRGICLWLCACLVAWPAAAFFDDKPELLYLLPVAGLTALIAGFNSTSIYVLNRYLRLSRETILVFTAKLISLLATIVAALITRSVWALIIGGVVNALATMILTHTVLPGPRSRLCWDAESRRALFAFGRWIFLSTLLTFFALQGDRIVLGKMIPSNLLGVYGLAYMLFEVPRTLITQLSQKVIFPSVSAVRDIPRADLQRRIRKNRRYLLAAAAGGLALLVSFGDVAVDILFTDRWQEAAWMLPLLATGLWFRVLDQTASPTLMAFGVLHYNPIGSVLRIFLVLGLLPLAIAEFDILGALVLIAAAELPGYVCNQIGLLRMHLSSVGQDLRYTAVFLVLVIAFLGGRHMAGFQTWVDTALGPETQQMIETYRTMAEEAQASGSNGRDATANDTGGGG